MIALGRVWRALPPLAWVALALGLGWGLTAAWGARELRQAHQQLRTEALRADSVEVAADTSRQRRLEADSSAQYWERRALQVELARDSVDEELGRVSRARVELAVTVPELRETVRGERPAPGDPAPADSLNDVRRAIFAGRRIPFTYRVAVALPAESSGLPPTAEISMAIDTIRAGARIQCAAEVGPGGVRRASILLRTEPWAAVHVDGVQYEPDVCSPPVTPPAARSPSLLWTLGGAAGGASIGAAVDTRTVRGAAIGAAVGALAGWLVRR